MSTASINVVPKPQQVEHGEGFFDIATAPAIVDATGMAGTAVQLLRESIGMPASRGGSAISFSASSAELGDEGYRLAVAPDRITVEASAPAGFFYATQTLLQLIDSSAGDRRVPSVTITDAPRFRWRGLMLDVSRHLMPIDGILRLLDCMAMHKLNTFHWHLTDDQGWRVESKKYPKLTQIGAFRRGADGELTHGLAEHELPHIGTYGGFYTHDDIRRVVARAAELHVRVVPEIEMPGHAMAAIAAYPELSCTGGPFETAIRTGIFKDVYCAGNDATFDFWHGVLDEILPLFPGEYVHVGGDECPKDRWKECPKCQARIRREGLKDEHELQSYVIRHMSHFLAERGKKLIGWDEILEGGLAEGATVMSWRGTAGGITAAQAARDVVMSPRQPCYFDYRQAKDGEPKAIGESINTLESMYAFDPIPSELTAEQATHVLGLQGNVWTEYMPDMPHVEYMIWPRAAALAEVGWSPAGGRDFADFARRAKAIQRFLGARGSRYRAVR